MRRKKLTDAERAALPNNSTFFIMDADGTEHQVFGEGFVLLDEYIYCRLNDFPVRPGICDEIIRVSAEAAAMRENQKREGEGGSNPSV